MRLSFSDSRVRDPGVYSRQQIDTLSRRLLDRPFWLNQRRLYWRYRLPFYNGEHWRILASGMTSSGWTARACVKRWITARRYWMPRR